MQEFEFIAVLLSIIFGLGITNLLAGMVRSLLHRQLDQWKMVWTQTVGLQRLVAWYLFGSFVLWTTSTRTLLEP